MEAGGYRCSDKSSHILALPHLCMYLWGGYMCYMWGYMCYMWGYICTCPSHMHVPARVCAYLPGFLIFWGIFRRPGWAVSLLAELFPHFSLTFLLPVALCPPRTPQTPQCVLEVSGSRPGQGTSPGASSWQRRRFSASSPAQELAPRVLLQWGAAPAERKPPREPRERTAYGNEARCDKPAARAASARPDRAEQRRSWRNFSCVVTSSKVVFQSAEMSFVVSEATSCTFTTFKSALLGFSRIRDREILLGLIIVWTTRALLFYMLICQALCSCLNNSV